MACWLRMADATGRDETSATDLKNGQLIPGAFMDETLLFCAAPRLLSPSVHKLSLPGPWTPITPCAEICESPIQDDGGASPLNGPLDDPQNEDITGYLSDESVRLTASFQDTDMLTLLYESTRTQTLPPKPKLTASGSNIAGRARMITNDSRSGTGHPSFHKNHCRTFHRSPPTNSPERFLHSRGYSAGCSLKTVPMLYVAILTSAGVLQLNFA